MEDAVEQDMRRMHKISDNLKADWEAKQRSQQPAAHRAEKGHSERQAESHTAATPTPTPTTTATSATTTPTIITPVITAKVNKAAGDKMSAVQLRGGAAAKTGREPTVTAPSLSRPLS